MKTKKSHRISASILIIISMMLSTLLPLLLHEGNKISAANVGETKVITKQNLGVFHDSQYEISRLYAQIPLLEASGKRVFCLEPGIHVEEGHTAIAYDPTSIELDGWADFGPGFQLSANRTLTQEQVDHLNLIAYYGWQESTHTNLDYYSTQLMMWNYIWNGRTTAMNQDYDVFLAKAQAIQTKLDKHFLLPTLTGTGFDATDNTLTIKVGDTITLTDTNGVLVDMLEKSDTTGIDYRISGNQITLTATNTSASGTLVFSKLGTLDMDDAVLFTDGKSQKILEAGLPKDGEYKLHIQVQANELLKIKKSVSSDLNLVKLAPKLYSLEGARFGVYSDVTQSQLVATLVTDANGESNEVELPVGTYYIQEIQAPRGFMLDKNVYTVELDGENSTTFQAKDKPKTDPLNVIMQKESAIENTDLSLAGAIFEVKYYPEIINDIRGNTAIRTWKFQTGTNGEIGFTEDYYVGGDPLFLSDNGIPTGIAGTYTFQELTPPKGFQLNPQLFYMWLREEGLTDSSNENGLIYQAPTVTEKIQTFEVELTKTDKDTGNPLEGAIFQLQDPTGQVLENLQSDENGYVRSSQHPLLFPNQEYKVIEIQAPLGYALDENPSQTFTPEADQSNKVLTYSKSFTNESITSPVKIQKFDVETGFESQGEASFSSASYDIVVVNLFDPINAPYAVGDVVETLTTDTNGNAISSPLVLGTYDLVEKTASPGYAVNPSAVRFSVTAEGETPIILQNSMNSSGLVEEINARIDELNQVWLSENSTHEPMAYVTPSRLEKEGFICTAERILYGRIELNKVFSGHYDTQGEPKQAEENIEFIVLDALGNTVDTLVTNTDGWASSKWLPYGSYTLRQSTEQDHAYPVKDITVTIDSDWNMYLYQLENEEVFARLQIVKKDEDTGNVIPQSGVIFELFKDDGTQVVQHLYYPTKKEISQFVTNEDGTVLLPEVLVAGNYFLKEVKAPEGYVLPSEDKEISFTVDRDSVGRSQDLIITLEVENKPAYGQIIISKTGEVLVGWESNPFTYEVFEEMGETEGETSSASSSTVKETSTTTTLVTTTKESTTQSTPIETTTSETPIATTKVSTTSLEEITTQATTVDETIPMVTTSAEITTTTLAQIKSTFSDTSEISSTMESEIITEDEMTIVDTEAATAKETTSREMETTTEADLANFAEETVVESTSVTGLHSENSQAGGGGIGSLLDRIWKKKTIDIYTPVYETQNLAGAVFEIRAKGDIFRSDGILAYKDGELVQKITTDGSARVESDVLPLGVYAVKEIKAPTGYARDAETHIITLTQANPNQALIQENVSLINRLQKMELRFDKKFEESEWFGAYEDAPSKVKFGLFTKEKMVHQGVTLPAGSYVAVAGVDENMQVVFKDLLPNSNYVLRELSTSEEYVLAEDIDVTLVPTDDTSVNSQVVIPTVTNQLREMEIVLVKVDSENPDKVLEGAEFKLIAVTASGDVEIGRYSSDEKGIIRISNLHVGDYYLEEVTPPPGYYKLLDPVKIELDGSSDQVEQVVENKITEVEISKVDIGGEEIPGAYLEVIDKDGNVIDFWISIEGEEHVIKGLVYGEEYTLREILAPDGFNKAQEIHFSVSEDGSVKTIDLINELTTTEISKTDIAGKEIAGAHLEVIDKDGSVVEEWISKENESHIIRGLVQDEKYTLRETIAPRGYILAQDIQFVVNTDGTTTKVHMINELTTTEISKTDIGGKEIAGAYLEIIDKDGNVVEEWISKENESHIIRGLVQGEEYILRETLAPKGFELAEDIAFKIRKDGFVTKVHMVDSYITKEVEVIEKVKEKVIPTVAKTGESSQDFLYINCFLFMSLALFIIKKKYT